MKTNYVTKLLSALWMTVFSFASPAQDTPGCTYFAHPKIRVVNLQSQPITTLPLGVKVDGIDRPPILWEGTLEAYAGITIELSPVALHQGLHTLSLYTPEHTASEVLLEWVGDHETVEADAVLPIASPPADSLASGEDCTCMRAADPALSQVNLWLYLTAVQPGQLSLTGSIDQGRSWATAVPEAPDQSCSDLLLPLVPAGDGTVRMRITTDKTSTVVARKASGAFSDTEEAELTASLTAYPNPFSEAVTIRYVLEDAAVVQGAVYTLQGRQVTTLIGETLRESGSHEVSFRPEALPGGVYVFRLQIGGQLKTHHLVYQKTVSKPKE